MKYYLDQEFNEYFKKPIPWLPTILKFNKPFHTIELISIGIVAEDGREYYSVCNEFDVKSAYNKCIVVPFLTSKNHSTNNRYEYWLRDNVLSRIFFDFYKQNLSNIHHTYSISLRKMKTAIKYGGKSKKKIAEEIRNFVCNPSGHPDPGVVHILYKRDSPQFYGYFADYDWVVFCSLFGTMMDLPDGFPMYCRDLKQMLDKYNEEVFRPDSIRFLKGSNFEPSLEECWEKIKKFDDYPKQNNEHHALSDAKWNQELHQFILNLHGL